MELPLLDSDRRFMELYPSGIPLIDMIPFYEAVDRDEPIKLEWICPGKRNPKEEVQANSVSQEHVPVDTSKSPLPQTSSKLAEFDFDEGSNQSDLASFYTDGSGPAGLGQGPSLPLRRVVGPGRHPPRQPHVANMDKILNDLFKSRKETPMPQYTTMEVPATSAATIAQTNESILSTETTQSEVTPESDNAKSRDGITDFENPMNPIIGTELRDNPSSTAPIGGSGADVSVVQPAPEGISIMVMSDCSQPNNVYPSPSVTTTSSTANNVTDSSTIQVSATPVISELPNQMARTQLTD